MHKADNLTFTHHIVQLGSNPRQRVGRPANNFLSRTNFDDVYIGAIKSLADVHLFLFYRRQ